MLLLGVGGGAFPLYYQSYDEHEMRANSINNRVRCLVRVLILVQVLVWGILAGTVTRPMI